MVKAAGGYGGRMCARAMRQRRIANRRSMNKKETVMNPPVPYTLDSGDEVVAGSVLALEYADLRDIPENAGFGPLILAIALTTDGSWIPVYSIKSKDGDRWTRPSAESVARLGHIIIDDFERKDTTTLEIGRELFLLWADILSDHCDLNVCLYSAADELDALAYNTQRPSHTKWIKDIGGTSVHHGRCQRSNDGGVIGS